MSLIHEVILGEFGKKSPGKVILPDLNPTGQLLLPEEYIYNLDMASPALKILRQSDIEDNPGLMARVVSYSRIALIQFNLVGPRLLRSLNREDINSNYLVNRHFMWLQ